MAVIPYKDGWRVNVYVGPKLADRLPPPYTGKERLTRVVTRDEGRRAANALDREWEALKESVRRSGPTSKTVGEAVEDFLALERKASTTATYRYALASLKDDFADQPLTAVTSDVARSRAATKPKGTIDVEKNLFRTLVDWGLIQTNPYLEVRSPLTKRNKTKAEFHAIWPLDPEKQRKVFSEIIAVAETTFGVGAAAKVAFAGWTGCRPGEVRGLHRTDLDAHKGEATICRTIDTLNVERRGTKNHLSRKVIVPPAPELLRLLADLPIHIDSPYVFTNGGKPWAHATWHARWDKIRTKAGHEQMRFYDLRHFCATQLLEMGLSPEDVAVQLGHTDNGELVRRVYGHPSEDEARNRIRNTLAAHFRTDSSHVRNIRSADSA